MSKRLNRLQTGGCTALFAALVVAGAGHVWAEPAEHGYLHFGDGPQWADWDGIDAEGGWQRRGRTVAARPDQPALIRYPATVEQAGHYHLWVQLRCTATLTVRQAETSEILARRQVNARYGQGDWGYWHWDRLAVYLKPGRYTVELSHPTVLSPYRDVEQYYCDVIVQDLILTDDLQFDPALQSGAYQIQWRRRVKEAPALGEGGLYLWTCDMYGRLLGDKDIGHNLGQEDGPDGRAHRVPVDEPRITELEITAAINEREVALLNVTSAASASTEVTVDCPTALTGPDGRTFPDRVQVLVGGHLWGNYGGLSVAPMFTSKDLTTELPAGSPRYWPTGDWRWGPQSIAKNVFNHEAIRNFPQLKIPPFDTVQLFLLVNTCINFAPIEHQEGLHGCMANSLIAVDKGVIHDQRMAESGSLGDYVRIEITAVKGETRLIHSGFKKAEISNSSGATRDGDHSFMQIEDFGE